MTTELTRSQRSLRSVTQSVILTFSLLLLVLADVLAFNQFATQSATDAILQIVVFAVGGAGLFEFLRFVLHLGYRPQVGNRPRGAERCCIHRMAPACARGLARHHHDCLGRLPRHHRCSFSLGSREPQGLGICPTHRAVMSRPNNRSCLCRRPRRGRRQFRALHLSQAQADSPSGGATAF